MIGRRQDVVAWATRVALFAVLALALVAGEIGRASCRERV